MLNVTHSTEVSQFCFSFKSDKREKSERDEVFLEIAWLRLMVLVTSGVSSTPWHST